MNKYFLFILFFMVLSCNNVVKKKLTRPLYACSYPALNWPKADCRHSCHDFSSLHSPCARLSQHDTVSLLASCRRDTAMIYIEKITEYLYVNKIHRRDSNIIVVYIINARYADTNHYHFMEPLVIVSVDTIVTQKKYKYFYCVNSINRNKTIREGETYLFHLKLVDCLPLIGGVNGGLNPSFFVVDGIRLPVELCPLQPFKAKELLGLNYSSITTQRGE